MLIAPTSANLIGFLCCDNAFIFTWGARSKQYNRISMIASKKVFHKFDAFLGLRQECFGILFLCTFRERNIRFKVRIINLIKVARRTEQCIRKSIKGYKNNKQIR